MQCASKEGYPWPRYAAEQFSCVDTEGDARGTMR
jgi:hypothetical protein